VKTEMRPVGKLTIHPALKAQPRLSDDEMLPWRRELKRKGPAAVPALFITEDNKIVDGRHRYWCAQKLQWPEIPVQVIPDSEVMSTIFATLLNRRHYTKGQRAYIVAEHIGEAFEEAKRRQRAGVEADRFTLIRTPENYAQEIGVTTRYLNDAFSIYKLYEQLPGKRTFTDAEGKKHKDVTAREYFELKIMDAEKPMGLGAAIAGLGFLVKTEARVEVRPHGGGRPQEMERQLQLFSKLVKDEDNRWEYWQKFDDEVRAEHFAAVRNAAEQLPPDVCRERADYHEKMAKQFYNAAKAGR